jgi:ABC-type dipeptide/oligopeptide/nickel transport system permease component
LLIQKAITQSDYNMILGCITISIVAISTATLIADVIFRSSIRASGTADEEARR